MNRYTRDQWQQRLWPHQPRSWQPWRAPEPSLQITPAAWQLIRAQLKPAQALALERPTAAIMLALAQRAPAPYYISKGELWILDPGAAAWAHLVGTVAAWVR